MKRPRIDTVPGLAEEVARMHAAGASNTEIAKAAGVKDRQTIAEWLKRDDVQLMVQRFVRENSNGILRHVTGQIRERLDAGEKMSTELLLKIYEKFAPNTLNLNLGGDPAEAMSALLKKLDEEPELARLLRGKLDEHDAGS